LFLSFEHFSKPKGTDTALFTVTHLSLWYEWEWREARESGTWESQIYLNSVGGSRY
jgi:hypothetical protein